VLQPFTAPVEVAYNRRLAPLQPLRTAAAALTRDQGGGALPSIRRIPRLRLQPRSHETKGRRASSRRICPPPFPSSRRIRLPPFPSSCRAQTRPRAWFRFDSQVSNCWCCIWIFTEIQGGLKVVFWFCIGDNGICRGMAKL
jgi:hypothetical protein